MSESFELMSVYRGTNEKPQHLSVAGIVLNNNNEILCLCRVLEGELVSYLPRETPHDFEVLEEAVERGLKEEAGCKVKIISYVGSTMGEYYRDVKVLKTTLYFLCKFISLDVTAKDLYDDESEATIHWMDLRLFVEQSKTWFINHPVINHANKDFEILEVLILQGILPSLTK
jgi:ADP-ribose pyrophosphatase YjhB (NUDIX family)